MQTMLDDPARERYGLELAQQAGLEPGTIYPILVAFENAGWLTSRDDDIDPHLEGRPRRRYYLLTAEGVTAGQAWVAAAARKRGHRAAPGRLAW